MVKNDIARKGYPHSYIEKLWDDMYLEGRWSLPINSNPYLALKTPPDHAAVPAGSDPQIVGATRYARCLEPCAHSGGFIYPRGEGVWSYGSLLLLLRFSIIVVTVQYSCSYGSYFLQLRFRILGVTVQYPCSCGSVFL